MTLPRLISATQAVTDDDARQWLQRVCERLAANRERPEYVLALTGPESIRQRNTHLRTAAALLEPDLSPWRQADVLGRAIRHFESTAWLRIKRGLPDSLHTLDGYRYHIACALLIGSCPTSQKRLHEAIATDSPPDIPSVFST